MATKALQISSLSQRRAHLPPACLQSSLGSFPLDRFTAAALPAVAVPPPSPSLTLSGACYWNKFVGDPIISLMTTAGYSESACERFSRAFEACIAPFMGPTPALHFFPRSKRLSTTTATSTQRAARWPSFMTDTYSPVEIGLAWKGECGQVRFSIEPFDVAEIESTGCNSDVGARRLLAALADVDGPFDLSLFNLLCSTFVEVSEARRQRSQVFLGFDVEASGSLDVKAYFVLPPHLQDLHALRSALSHCGHRDVERALQGSMLRDLASHLEQLGDGERGHPIILAIDLAKQHQHGEAGASRLKLYWRFPGTTSAAGSAIHASLDTAQQAMWETRLDRIWHRVIGSEHLAASSSTPGCLCYYDLTDESARSGKSSSKVYVPVRHRGQRTEKEAIEAIGELLSTSGCIKHDLFESLSIAFGGGHQIGRGFVTYICLQRGVRADSYFLYLNPPLPSW